MSVNKYPIDWRKTNEVDGRDHICSKDQLQPQPIQPKRDPRLDIRKCVRCNAENSSTGYLMNYGDYVRHKQLFGCTEYKMWSIEWITWIFNDPARKKPLEIIAQ